MNLRIRRRRFGQLALASAATAAISSLASKTNAQTSASLSVLPGLVGVGVTTTTTTSTQPSSVLSTVVPIVGDVINLANNTTGINLIDSSGKTTSIPSTTVQNTGTIPNVVNNAVSTLNQRIASLTTASDGTLVTATVKDAQNILVSQLTFISPNSTQANRSVTLSGFTTPNAVIESMLPMSNGQYLGIVSLNRGVPPFELATIDPQTGVVTSGKQLADLKTDARYSNLTTAPDGSIYATTLGREGRTRVVKIDLNNKSLITGKGTIVPILDLSINNQPLDNDVLSLTYASDGTLYVLANPTRQPTNSVYAVDTNNKGSLSFVTTITAQKITFRVNAS